MTKPRKQCAKCPWKVSTDPHDIPDGYSEELHANLACTIAKPGALPLPQLQVMTCHEAKRGYELPCVGWFVNQRDSGNNIGLRLAILTKHIDPNVRTVGPQHECFEDTLP